MFVTPRDIDRRALQLVTQLAPEHDNPAAAPALRTAIELAIDADLELAAIAEAAAMPVGEIAAIATEHMTAHHELIEQHLAESGERFQRERHLLGWRLRSACAAGMNITTAADCAGVTTAEATALIEESPLFRDLDPDEPPSGS